LKRQPFILSEFEGRKHLLLSDLAEDVSIQLNSLACRRSSNSWKRRLMCHVYGTNWKMSGTVCGVLQSTARSYRKFTCSY